MRYDAPIVPAQQIPELTPKLEREIIFSQMGQQTDLSAAYTSGDQSLLAIDYPSTASRMTPQP